MIDRVLQDSTTATSLLIVTDSPSGHGEQSVLGKTVFHEITWSKDDI
jgi:hypothetical protein